MTCSMRSSIDRYFAGELDEHARQQLGKHLSVCEECRAYYEGTELVVQPVPRNIRSMIGSAIFLLFVVGGIGLLFLLPEEPPETEAQIIEVERYLQAQDRDREKEAVRQKSPARLWVYRRAPVGQPMPIENELKPDDELSFKYENASGWEYLLVFAVDEHDRMYWYYPGWGDEETNPAAVAIAPKDKPTELPPTVNHRFEGTWITLYAIFTHRVLTVRDIEALLKGEREPGSPVVPDSFEQTFLIRVTPPTRP
jgi:hypothetical protein